MGSVSDPSLNAEVSTPGAPSGIEALVEFVETRYHVTAMAITATTATTSVTILFMCDPCQFEIGYELNDWLCPNA